MSRRKTERLLNLVVCLLATRRYLTAEQIRQAVPGYPPHPALLERLAATAATPAAASYGPILGDAILREAYAAHLGLLYGAKVAADEVWITTGCNQGFFGAAVAVAEAEFAPRFHSQARQDTPLQTLIGGNGAAGGHAVPSSLHGPPWRKGFPPGLPGDGNRRDEMAAWR